MKYTKVVALCLLVAVTSSWLTATIVAQSPVEKARNRAVFLQTPDSDCSGVVLQANLVLTCAHCIEKGQSLKVNGKVATLLRIDEKVDLALISVGTIMVDKVAIADTFSGEDIFTWGFPYSSPNVVFSKGNVSVIQFDRVFSSVSSNPGASGSGVYNMNGELVGILSAHSATGLAVSISPANIRSFLQ